MLPMFLEQIRQIALDYPDTEEYFQWRDRAFFRGIKGRNFLYANERKDHLEVLLRIPPGKQAEISELPFVEQHKSIGHKGWFIARIRKQSELDAVKPFIAISYEINKPFRTVADRIEGENPAVIDYLEQVRQKALSFSEDGTTEIEEYFPFGDRAFRVVGGKIFLYASEYDEGLYLNVRLPMGIREHALSMPNVEVPKYIGHQGWVGVRVKTPEQLNTAITWIDISYEENLVKKKSRKK